MAVHKRWITLILSALFSGCLIMYHPMETGAAFKINRFYYEKKGEVVWDLPSERKEVAITFDDGPNPAYTNEILDTLKKYDAKATFFLVGRNVARHPAIVKREVAEGHELGNHTYTHPYRLPPSAYKKEIDATEKLIEQYQKNQVKLFRPPGGTLNKPIINYTIKKGYKILLWSWHQDPRDWMHPSASSIATHVVSHVRNGDVILLHDAGGNRQETVKAVKMILPILKKKGYKFVTVSQLMMKHERFASLFKQDPDLEPFRIFNEIR
ncbi:polysaccharide deacetylase family sporulation protein PdaB [Fictibacillus macauensis ZFHKF-1]|uniref:Polysaccharide deacetylase family sporulation protein PdaB n=1 Tax=Fictibacillus macauensis ZFHKF-1 TaxID=1196324 RepID=I8ALD1_9BACL|nr:polysaccharide deacetylase family protein [Fictibacillus macauensis]EIT86424.1 polysaccharide deacetylase family sporulation protein PdaB [Fictibacillus macauensis ZFHKF-1]